MSVVHAIASLQLTGVSATQPVSALQVSTPSQNRPLLHSASSACGRTRRWPRCTHRPCTRPSRCRRRACPARQPSSALQVSVPSQNGPLLQTPLSGVWSHASVASLQRRSCRRSTSAQLGGVPGTQPVNGIAGLGAVAELAVAARGVVRRVIARVGRLVAGVDRARERVRTVGRGAGLAVPVMADLGTVAEQPVAAVGVRDAFVALVGDVVRVDVVAAAAGRVVGHARARVGAAGDIASIRDVVGVAVFVPELERVVRSHRRLRLRIGRRRADRVEADAAAAGVGERRLSAPVRRRHAGDAGVGPGDHREGHDHVRNRIVRREALQQRGGHGVARAGRVEVERRREVHLSGDAALQAADHGRLTVDGGARAAGLVRGREHGQERRERREGVVPAAAVDVGVGDSERSRRARSASRRRRAGRRRSCRSKERRPP